MSRTKLFISLIVAISVLAVQIGTVSAAPALQSAPVGGTVQRITLETDPSTGITTVIVDVLKTSEEIQTIRISEKSAVDLGLVLLNGDGKAIINKKILGKYVEIAQEAVIPADEENKHPVADALATFFKDIPGMDYSTIMTAHEKGVGFGVLAQILWMTQNLEGGDSGDFLWLVRAKQTGEFEGATFEDGTTVKNWAQLQKALMDGKKIGNLGSVMSNKDTNVNANSQSDEKDKEKKDNNRKEKDSGNNGNGTGNGNKP